MKILLVAATDAEISGLKGLRSDTIDVLLTGVGMVHTCYAMMKQLQQKKYDIAVQAGICGAFDRQLALGEVVQVMSETFADLGAEDDTDFKTVFELGLMAPDKFPFLHGKINLESPSVLCLQKIKKVHAITVNTVHGNETSIIQAEQKFHAQIESMEGAAFAYVCRMQNISCVQVRAVSNYVEKRNKLNWKMEEAVANLSEVLDNILTELLS